MLVLSRRPSERIVLHVGGLRVDLVVVEIRSDKVRLGIDAPPEISVLRAELLDRPQTQGTSQ